VVRSYSSLSLTLGVPGEEGETSDVHSEEHRGTFPRVPSTIVLTSSQPELGHMPTFETLFGKSYGLRYVYIILDARMESTSSGEHVRMVCVLRKFGVILVRKKWKWIMAGKITIHLEENKDRPISHAIQTNSRRFKQQM
jgi:hypothetical protein